MYEMHQPSEWKCEDCGAEYADTAVLESGPYGYACPSCDGIWVTATRLGGGADA